MKEKPIIKHISDIQEIIAGDHCYLREVFHPERDEVKTGYSLAYAYIKKGGSTINHYLLQSETYFIISGEGKMHLDDQVFDVKKGSSYYVPAKSHQWLENTGEERIEFMVVVDPPWNATDEFVLE